MFIFFAIVCAVCAAYFSLYFACAVAAAGHPPSFDDRIDWWFGLAAHSSVRSPRALPLSRHALRMDIVGRRPVRHGVSADDRLEALEASCQRHLMAGCGAPVEVSS